MRQDDRPIIRPMRRGDAAKVIDMAYELAAAVGEGKPKVAESDLVKDGPGPERWFDCLVAEAKGELVGYALVCKRFEAHTGGKRLWLSDLYVQPIARRNGTGRALMMAVARHALQLAAMPSIGSFGA